MSSQCECSSQSSALLPGVSLLQSSPSLLWPASGLRLCIQSPQREWSTRPFMCRGMLDSSQRSSPPSASPKAPSSVVPVETRVAPPAAVSSPCPGFQNALLCCGSLDHTAANQTNWWVKSEHTQNILYSQAYLTLLLIRRSLIHFIWGVKTGLR